MRKTFDAPARTQPAATDQAIAVRALVTRAKQAAIVSKKINDNHWFPIEEPTAGDV